MQIDEALPGRSRCSIALQPHHLNVVGIVHGGVLFTLADTGMGSALQPALPPGHYCATVEIKMNYFRPVVEGTLTCASRVVYQGRTLANLESEVFAGERLLAKANGTFAILRRDA